MGIHSLNITNQMTASEYLNIDGEDETAGHDDVPDIVAALTAEERDDSDEGDHQNKISTGDALKACDTMPLFRAAKV